MKLNKLYTFSLLCVFSMSAQGQTLEWDNAQWNDSNWETGGNTDFLDTDGDGELNLTDIDDDGDGLSDAVEQRFGLDPLDATDADADFDEDGLSNREEIALGTDINNADTDGDGIDDGADTNPLEEDSVDEDLLANGTFHLLADMNQDGVREFGLLRVDEIQGSIVLDVHNGVDAAFLQNISWIDNYVEASIQLLPLQDLNGNAVDDIGLFGIRDDSGFEGRAQLFARDGLTGARINVYNWIDNWREVEPVLLGDLNDDGVNELAIQGRFNVANRPQLIVRDGDSATNNGVFSFPNLFNNPFWQQHGDATGDGIGEVSIFGRLRRNNRIQIRVVDGTDQNNRLVAYNFRDNWTDIAWHLLGDINRDGVREWGLFGISRTDGRPQLLNRDGVTPRAGVLRIHAWPSQIQSPQFFLIPDLNEDGIEDVGVVGIRSNNGRHQFQVQDGTNRNNILVNLNLNLVRINDVSYHVLPDLTGDQKVEFGFLGERTDGAFELFVYEGEIGDSPLRIYNIGNDWSSEPSLHVLGDINDDAVDDLMFFGSDADGNVLIRYFSGAESLPLNE